MHKYVFGSAPIHHLSHSANVCRTFFPFAPPCPSALYWQHDAPHREYEFTPPDAKLAPLAGDLLLLDWSSNFALVLPNVIPFFRWASWRSTRNCPLAHSEMNHPRCPSDALFHSSNARCMSWCFPSPTLLFYWFLVFSWHFHVSNEMCYGLQRHICQNIFICSCICLYM